MLHVFQFQDATWRLDRPARCTIPFIDLIRHDSVRELYEGIYPTRAEAYAAKGKIEALLASIEASRRDAEAVMASEPDNGDRFW